MAKSLNIVIGADIEKLREGFNKAIAIVQKSSNQMSAEVAKSAKSMEERLAAIATRNPTMGSVRQLTQLAMEARALGPEFAQVANEIIKQAGRMKDSIADTRAEVGYFASDTRRLDAVLGGVQAAAGAFGAMQGAMQLAGLGGKDLQEAMVKLQSAMAIVNGLTAIQNALQEESAVRQGLSAAATSIYTAATNGATVATRAMNLALAAGPWVLISVAILAVGVLLSKMGAEAAAAEKKIAKLKETQDSLLSNAAKKIKLEERRLEIAIATAKAEGKNEAFILNLKRNSLATQKALYKKAGEEAMALSNQRKQEELDAITGFNRKAQELEIYTKYEKENKEIRTSLNEEYQNKLHAFDLDEIESNRTVGKEKIKITKAVIKETEQLTAKNTGGSLLAPVDPIVKQSMADVLAELDKIPPVLDDIKSEPLFTDIIEEGPEVVATTVEVSDAFKTMADRNSASFQQHASALNASAIKTAEWAAKTETALDAINAAFATLQMETAESIGQFIADMATGDEAAGKNFGKNMLGAIAGFMDSLGKALVTTAIAAEAFQKLIVANPAAAAVAGIALIAGAAIVRNKLKEGANVTAFADGGIVSGPTLGLMGEYPGASSNPEVIAPLDKLKGMLKSNDSSGFVASTSIQGRDLAIVLERYNRDSSRG
jgi:hypothetical protein